MKSKIMGLFLAVGLLGTPVASFAQQGEDYGPAWQAYLQQVNYLRGMSMEAAIAECLTGTVDVNDYTWPILDAKISATVTMGNLNRQVAATVEVIRHELRRHNRSESYMSPKLHKMIELSANHQLPAVKIFVEVLASTLAQQGLVRM